MAEKNRYSDNIREQYIRRFEVVSVSDRHVIAFDGEPYIILLRDTPLPYGFHDRLIRMIAEMLVGKRTELWDSHAIYGDNSSPSRAEIMAKRDTSVVEEGQT